MATHRYLTAGSCRRLPKTEMGVADGIYAVGTGREGGGEGAVLLYSPSGSAQHTVAATTNVDHSNNSDDGGG